MWHDARNSSGIPRWRCPDWVEIRRNPTVRVDAGPRTSPTETAPRRETIGRCWHSNRQPIGRRRWFRRCPPRRSGTKLHPDLSTGSARAAGGSVVRFQKRRPRSPPMPGRGRGCCGRYGCNGKHCLVTAVRETNGRRNGAGMLQRATFETKPSVRDSSVG